MHLQPALQRFGCTLRRVRPVRSNRSLTPSIFQFLQRGTRHALLML
jgi:hypothetical protein